MTKLKRLPLLFKAWRLLLFLRFSLWLFPFEKVKTIMQKMSILKSPEYEFGQIIKVVNQVKFFVPRATCLSRALTAKVLVAQSGHQIELCIGVAKNQSNQLEAHAWLEKDGVVVMNNLEGLSNFIKLSSQF